MLYSRHLPDRHGHLPGAEQNRKAFFSDDDLHSPLVYIETALYRSQFNARKALQP
jgi:hypothetical protein